MLRVRMRRWNRKASVAGGISPRMEAAATSFGYEYMLNIPASVGGNVCAGEPVVRISEKVNSFQQIRKAITAHAATAGAAIGSMIFQNACQRVRPSTRAARSALRGSEAKKPLMIQAIRGIVTVR